MPMRVVITGANRGIGLELARQCAARGDEVFAGVRDPSRAEELRKLAGTVHVHACDVGSDSSVRAFASAVSGPIDLVINNAGVGGKYASLEEVDFEDALRVYDVDALGPLRMSQAFLPHLEKGAGKKLVHVTSGMGSITDNASGGAYAYRMAKAALNMASRSMAVDLRGRGIVSVVINPGWVKTDMGGRGAPTPVEESVRGILARIDEIGPKDSGEFLDWKPGKRWPF